MSKFNYPPETINIFKRKRGYESNEDIEKFVKKYIGISKYSFHQINIFIKLFISQYSQFKSKLKFLEGGKDMTGKFINSLNVRIILLMVDLENY